MLQQYFQAKMSLKGLPFKIPVLVVVLPSIFCVFFMTGIIFGYPSLLPVLLDHNVYHHLCQNAPNVTSNITESDQIEGGLAEEFSEEELEASCPLQTLRLNAMFISSSSALNIFSLILGIFQDYQGVRATGMLSGVLFSIGCIFFSLSLRGVFDGYIPGFILFAVGGVSIYLPSLTLSAKDPPRAGIIFAVLSCSFDASAIVFWFLNRAYFSIPKIEQKRTNFLNDIFFVYLIIPSIAFIISYFRLSKEEEALENQLASFEDDDKDDLPKPLEDKFQKQEDDQLLRDGDLPLRERPILRQYFSPEFIYLVLTVSAIMIGINFYVGSTVEQLQDIAPRTNVHDMASYFSVIMGLGALAAAPVVGWLIDNLGYAIVFFITCVLFLVFQILILIKILWLQWISMIAFTFLRAFFYSVAAALIPFYFGYEQFGKVYGMMMMISGVVNMICIPMTNITLNWFDGHFFYMNVLVTILALITFLYPIYLFKTIRR